MKSNRRALPPLARSNLVDRIVAIRDNPSKMAKLQNLCGPLAQHNGKLVHPVGSRERGFTADLTANGSLKLQLMDINVACVDNFDVLCNTRKTTVRVQRKDAQDAHGSVRTVVSKVTTQLRQAIASSMTAAQRALPGALEAKLKCTVFEADEDGDGVVTKAEFRSAMKKQGLALSDMELILLWEAFDKDGDGVLDPSELLEFVASAKQGGNRRGSLLNLQVE